MTKQHTLTPNMPQQDVRTKAILKSEFVSLVDACRWRLSQFQRMAAMKQEYVSLTDPNRAELRQWMREHSKEHDSNKYYYGAIICDGYLYRARATNVERTPMSSLRRRDQELARDHALVLD